MVSCSLRCGSAICSLYFKVEFPPFAVCTEHIKTDRAGAEQSFHIILSFFFYQLQVFDTCDDPQNKLCKGKIIAEKLTHKIIVDRAVIFNGAEVIFMPLTIGFLFNKQADTGFR